MSRTVNGTKRNSVICIVLAGSLFFFFILVLQAPFPWDLLLPRTKRVELRCEKYEKGLDKYASRYSFEEEEEESHPEAMVHAPFTPAEGAPNQVAVAKGDTVAVIERHNSGWTCAPGHAIVRHI